MIWNERIETMSPDNLKNIQSENLIKMINYIYNNSSFYKKRLDEYGINPSDIKSINDLKKLPFTTKDDMRDNYPYGIFSDTKNLAEIHVSSGTTGNPTLVGYTKNDLDLWAEVIARSIGCAGGKPGDTIQIAYGYGLFTGGLGFHYGALKMGLVIIPCSSGQTKRQLKIMEDFKPKILACTPSYALYMAEEAREIGMDPRKSSWKIGCFGAEPWSENMRRQIEDAWGMKAYDVYGLSEIIGPGVAHECEHKAGLHVFSDVFYSEVIDPVTGIEVPEGTDGELVITTFTKEGIPLLRYRTRDIVSIANSICKCGRTSPRISKIKGRTDDMIVVRGINVFPSQIEHILMQIEGTQPHYQLVVDRTVKNLDMLEVHVEVEEKVFSDEIKNLRNLEEKIKDEIDSILGISVSVKLLEPKSIERSMGKAIRVIDKRKI